MYFDTTARIPFDKHDDSYLQKIMHSCQVAAGGCARELKRLREHERKPCDVEPICVLRHALKAEGASGNFRDLLTGRLPLNIVDWTSMPRLYICPIKTSITCGSCTETYPNSLTV